MALFLLDTTTLTHVWERHPRVLAMAAHHGSQTTWADWTK